MRGTYRPWRSLGLVMMGLLLLFCFSCKSGSRSHQFKQCHARQTKMLEACQPICTESPEAGESLDSCLDRCAGEKFGGPIPDCNELSGPK